MSDAGFQVVFWVFCGVAALVIVGAVLVMLAHFAVFGVIVAAIVKRVGQGDLTKATGAPCEHCGSAVPAGGGVCPSCGAPVG